jgi:CDP-diacylglycerol--glycerol-3-phosphate 3-phosphatidyltransferase
MIVFSSNLDIGSPPRRPRAALLAATSLTFLKPQLKRALRPLVEVLFRAGIAANQVTVTSLIGSVAVGVLLSFWGHRSALFGLLPVWLSARMILAAIDGTLAIDFGLKSRRGGLLNDAGDMLSDVALFVPLCFAASFQPGWVALVIALTALCEVVGIVAGTMRGGSHRLDGPFGEADRRLAPAVIGVWIACNGSPPPGSVVLYDPPPDHDLNRVRFGAAEIRDSAAVKSGGGRD